MKSIDDLLDEVKAAHAIKSDYKLAQFLGLTDGAIRNYRHGRSYPDERACALIGEALGIDGDVLAAQMQARRATNPDTRAFWDRIAMRLGGAMAGVLGVVLGALMLVSAPTPAHAGTGADQPNQRALYIMYSCACCIAADAALREQTQCGVEHFCAPLPSGGAGAFHGLGSMGTVATAVPVLSTQPPPRVL